jgi:dTDP-4-dehydrorhamnose 3,5-epimerase
LDGVSILSGNKLIEGVNIVPLRRIPDERGTVFHMLRSTDPHFKQFGEIYFSSIYSGIVKGWHKHALMTLNYACVFGRIKLVLYDDRQVSPTRGTIVEVFLGQDNYSLAMVPPGVWNGFKGMSEPFALVANCSTHAHDASQSVRMDPFKNDIPYDWDVKQN